MKFLPSLPTRRSHCECSFLVVILSSLIFSNFTVCKYMPKPDTMHGGSTRRPVERELWSKNDEGRQKKSILNTPYLQFWLTELCRRRWNSVSSVWSPLFSVEMVECCIWTCFFFNNLKLILSWILFPKSIKFKKTEVFQNR